MKEYEELNFTDDFMFCKVMTNNPDLCHELLELIIGHKIGKFTRLDKQAPIEITADGKGVRFDVYSEDDEIRKIFLCAGGTADDVSDDMKDFLDWLIGKQGKSELVKALDNAVQKARNHEEWRLEYMTLLMRDQEMIRRGREEGLQAGRLQEIFLSVQEGDYSIERAAQKAGMDIQSVEKAMVDAGYKIPECV